MRKSETLTGNGHISRDFHADVKFHTAPEIKKIKNVHGVPTYVLANGNTQSVESYNNMWKRPRMQVKPKNKIEKPDRLMVLDNKNYSS